MDLSAVLAGLRCEPLHERLRQIREKVGISQRQLADACGLAPSVICRLEAGADARLTTWIRAFAALGCELTVHQVSQEELVDHWPELMRRRDNRLKGLEPNW